jgi:tetratricopeptide (TPR) repeat protein
MDIVTSRSGHSTGPPRAWLPRWPRRSATTGSPSESGACASGRVPSTWHIGDAHCWRAWNRLRLRALDEAEADAAQALTLLANTHAFTVAGAIALERRALDEARGRLARAREMDRDNCQALWLLGLVEIEDRGWEPAADAFRAAAACYGDEATREERDRLAAAANTAIPADVRERWTVRHERARDEALLQRARSSFNAAQALVQLGRSSEAREALAPALGHPAMREKAQALFAKLLQQARR